MAKTFINVDGNLIEANSAWDVFQIILGKLIATLIIIGIICGGIFALLVWAS